MRHTTVETTSMIQDAASVHNEAIGVSLHDTPSRILEGKKLGHVIVNLTRLGADSVRIYPLTSSPERGDYGYRWREQELASSGGDRTLAPAGYFDGLAPGVMAVVYRGHNKEPHETRPEYESETLWPSESGLSRAAGFLAKAKESLLMHDWRYSAEEGLQLGAMAVDFSFAHFPELSVNGYEQPSFLKAHVTALESRLGELRSRQISGNKIIASEIRFTMKAIDVARRRLLNGPLDSTSELISQRGAGLNFDPAS